MTVLGNGGKLSTNKKADLEDDYGEVWFDKRAITNILSLKKVPENQPTVQPGLPVQDPVPVRRSTRDRQPIQRLEPTMSGKRHAKGTLPVVEHVSDDTPPDYDFVMFICMMQMSVKAGLKKFEQQKAKKRLPKS